MNPIDEWNACKERASSTPLADWLPDAEVKVRAAILFVLVNDQKDGYYRACELRAAFDRAAFVCVDLGSDWDMLMTHPKHLAKMKAHPSYNTISDAERRVAQPLADHYLKRQKENFAKMIADGYTESEALDALNGI